jgi:predicted helicase
LTDTLTAPQPDVDSQKQMPLFGFWGDVQRTIVAEQHHSDEVKSRKTPIQVVIGNPPYDRTSISKSLGGAQDHRNFVVGRVAGFDELPLLEGFIESAKAAGAGGHLKNLYNLYVYFWRWAIWKTCEQIKGQSGIVTFITPASFLRGPGFVGMREYMRRRFDEIWLIDLGGEGRGARKEDNVFAIQTPVCITVALQRPHNPDGTARTPASRAKQPSDVWYRRIRGTRGEKLAALNAIELLDAGDVTNWTVADYDGKTKWQAPFVPAGEAGFFDWPELPELFPWTRSGCKYQRTWPIAPSAVTLERRWNALFAPAENPDAALRERFRENVTNGRTVNSAGVALDGSKRSLPALASEGAQATRIEAVQYGYRSFDRMWSLPDSRVGDRMADPLWLTHSNRQAYLVTLTNTSLGAGPAAVVSAHVPDLHYFRSSYGGKDVMPMYRDGAALEPNVNHALLARLTATYGHTVVAEDLFAYVFALLGTGAYVARHADDLNESVSRVPITRDYELFQRVVAFGHDLLGQATYGERFGAVNDYGAHVLPKVRPGAARQATSPQQARTQISTRTTPKLELSPSERAGSRTSRRKSGISRCLVCRS